MACFSSLCRLLSKLASSCSSFFSSALTSARSDVCCLLISFFSFFRSYLEQLVPAIKLITRTFAKCFESPCLLLINSFRLVIEFDILVEVMSILSCISLHCSVTAPPDERTAAICEIKWWSSSKARSSSAKRLLPSVYNCGLVSRPIQTETHVFIVRFEIFQRIANIVQFLLV